MLSICWLSDRKILWWRVFGIILRQMLVFARLMIVGPGKAGAILEGSRILQKEFMFRHHIPTAGYLTVTKDNLEEGFAFLETQKPPYVLKADGLAAGKRCVDSG